MSNPYMVKVGNPTAATGGTFSGSYPAQIITDIQALGAQTVFYQVRWDNIDTSGGITQASSGYVWTSWDNAVSQCNQAGIDIILAVMFPPHQLQKVVSGSTIGVAQTSYLTTFCQQIAHAYTNGDAGQRGTRHIKGIYVGNEDYDNNGTGGLPAELVLAMKAVYGPIKAINPSMLVIAGAKLQRNLSFYNSWFGTLLNSSTGAYIAGAFQADVITFHYHSAAPWDSNGNPLSPDPSQSVVSGGITIPSWRQCWQAIQTQMQANNMTVDVWADENGESVNVNPGRPLGTVISESTRAGYIQYELDEARNSGVVKKYGIFTIAEFAGYPAPNYRDGQSLIQGPSNAPTYGATWTMMQNNIQTYPTWVTGVKSLVGKAAGKFVTKKSGLTTKTRSKFKNKTHLVSKAFDTFIISYNPVLKELLTRSRAKFKVHFLSKFPNYGRATLTGVDGRDTFTGSDGTNNLTGIG